MTRRARTARRARLGVVTAVVLVAGIAVSAVATAVVADQRSGDRVDRFMALAERARLAVEARVDATTAVQEVLRDAIVADWPVDRRTFRNTVAGTNGDDPFEGVRAVAFDRVVPADRRTEYEATVAADTSVEPGGYPGFRVRPPTSPYDDLFVVEYLEPAEGNLAAFGFDIGSDSRRREAVEQARDLGEVIATAPIRLVQGSVPPGNADDLGVLLVSAIYDTPDRLLSQPSRRRHFVGAVVSAVSSRELLRGALESVPGLEMEIYDQGPTVRRPSAEFGPGNVVFDRNDTRSVGPGGDDHELLERLDIDVGGRRWSLMFQPTDAFATEGIPPWLVMLVGMLLTGAVGAVIAAVTGARERAEELAQRRTVDLRSTLASAPDATVVVDADGTIVLASDRVEELLGYAPEELLGLPVETLVPESARTDHVLHRIGYEDSPGPRMMGEGLALDARHRDGSTIPVEISLNPLPEHSLGTVVASLRDVTAQRRAFRELQRANEMQTSFLSTVSHELRTPLTAIEGFSKLLLDAPDRFGPDERESFLRRIMRNSSNLGHLIEELIEYSRLERDTQVLHPVHRDLLMIATELVDQLGVVVETHPITVDGRSTPVLVDPTAVTRILTNLLTNAVRYSPTGGEIRIEVVPSDDGRHAVLSVEDDGPGIPPDERGRVFGRFWRGEQAQAAAQMGTGVGLAVVHDLCRLSGGSVSVGDAPSGGARFVVTLPATTPPDAPSDDEAPATRQRGTE